MTAAAEMPEDVMQAAREAYHSAFGWSESAKDVDIYAAIAKAILAERQSHSAVRRTNSADAAAVCKIIDEGNGFADTNPEARFIADAELSCPHCGGSGHKDDVRDQWQPIETAPKDGNWIVLHSPAHALPEFAYWDGDEFATGTCGLSPVFTHWQPLPAAPKGGAA